MKVKISVSATRQVHVAVRGRLQGERDGHAATPADYVSARRRGASCRAGRWGKPISKKSKVSRKFADRSATVSRTDGFGATRAGRWRADHAGAAGVGREAWLSSGARYRESTRSWWSCLVTRHYCNLCSRALTTRASPRTRPCFQQRTLSSSPPMFYAPPVLTKKGPLAKVWLAATFHVKLTKTQVFSTDVTESCRKIAAPDFPMALRLTSSLLLGVSRIHNRQAHYVLCEASDAVAKIRWAFRAAGGAGSTATASATEGGWHAHASTATVAALAAITLGSVVAGASAGGG
eukprot:ctg_754.g443